MSDTIEISKKEYFELRCAQLCLDMLNYGGVDNWEGYFEALNPEDAESYADQVTALDVEMFGCPIRNESAKGLK